jgi:hypothetical protein
MNITEKAVPTVLPVSESPTLNPCSVRNSMMSGPNIPTPASDARATYRRWRRPN